MVIALIIIFTMFIDSISLLVVRATVPEATELVATIMFATAYFAFMRREVLRLLPLILSIIVLVGGIF